MILKKSDVTPGSINQTLRIVELETELNETKDRLSFYANGFWLLCFTLIAFLIWQLLKGVI